MPRNPHQYYVIETCIVRGGDGTPTCRVILECSLEAVRAAPLYQLVRLARVRTSTAKGRQS